MYVQGGLFEEEPAGRGREKREGDGGVNMIEVHYIHA
jgi:hypothetical protein